MIQSWERNSILGIYAWVDQKLPCTTDKFWVDPIQRNTRNEASQSELAQATTDQFWVDPIQRNARNEASQLSWSGERAYPYINL